MEIILTYISNKSRKYIFPFRIFKDISIKKLLFLCTQSLLSFGIIPWGRASKGVIYPLDIVQKRVLKVAFNNSMWCVTDTLFRESLVLGNSAKTDVHFVVRIPL